jgi:hypothetical protein
MRPLHFEDGIECAGLHALGSDDIMARRGYSYSAWEYMMNDHRRASSGGDGNFTPMVGNPTGNSILPQGNGHLVENRRVWNVDYTAQFNASFQLNSGIGHVIRGIRSPGRADIEPQGDP